MNKILIGISVESKKIFRSRIPLLTTLALTMVPFVGGFFMFILKDPSVAQKLGFISAKAQIIGTADWPSYLSLLAQAIAIGGLLVFGFIISWIFGREYSDRTIKDLLALPISRNIIVFSKFIVAVIWCLFLSLYVLVLGLVVGKMVDIPGWSSDILIQGTFVFIFCSMLTILLSTPVAFFASIGHGYLSPLGFMVFTLVLAQIVAATGYGQFFPWSIPALASGIIGSDSVMIEDVSIIIVLLTSLFGLLGTIFWWRYADQG
ncbi:ABC transporter permease [Sedimentibacter sp. MB31-C6]|uniref:ABC transporter permease n=1 Tax=Sedimentibacter sp. MB31-C6 TaxID=3109366 RepID=UPI002DDD5434|nr:ABC transporter permease [Sedimentibacter sp. MB36-C1]WSI03231.1 ABC transporter permease [Sedimentibacter sp. MB36-C1]